MEPREQHHALPCRRRVRPEDHAAAGGGGGRGGAVPIAREGHHQPDFQALNIQHLFAELQQSIWKQAPRNKNVRRGNNGDACRGPVLSSASCR